MRIGAFFFNSPVALLTEKLLPPLMVAQLREDPVRAIQMTGTCFDNCMMTDIWIADLQHVPYQCLASISSEDLVSCPRQVGPNILLVPDLKIDNIVSSHGQKGVQIRSSCHVSKRLEPLNASKLETNGNTSRIEESVEEFEPLYTETDSLKSSIISGFELVSAAGPL